MCSCIRPPGLFVPQCIINLLPALVDPRHPTSHSLRCPAIDVRRRCSGHPAHESANPLCTASPRASPPPFSTFLSRIPTSTRAAMAITPLSSSARAARAPSTATLSFLSSALRDLRVSQPAVSSISQKRNASHQAQGRANGAKDGAGKRLGAKKTGGEYVIPGNILFKQRGTHWFPGDHAFMVRFY